MEKRFHGNVRKPIDDDEKDPKWRLVDESDRKFVTTLREIEEQLNIDRVIPFDCWKTNA